MTDHPEKLPDQSSAPSDTPGDTVADTRGDAADAPFDDLLRAAMLARPQPTAAPDLVMRAMALATADESVRLTEQRARLVRHRRWAQIASIAAAILIVAMIAGAVRRMDIGALMSSSAADTSTADATPSDADSSTDTATTSVSSTTSTITVVFVAGLLVLGVVLMSLSRRAPTTAWGAEALVGLW